MASTSKFIAENGDDDMPKEAFGHPIEPGYVKLVRPPRQSISPSTKPKRASLSPSKSSSSASVNSKGDGSTLDADSSPVMSNGHNEPIDVVK